MRQSILMVMAFAVSHSVAYTQTQDSIQTHAIEEVIIVSHARQRQQLQASLALEIISAEEFDQNFSGNFMQSLEELPGIQSMSVGSGFSKPMIRGMAFNRVSVVEQGIKQEGQQWGADHGLEVDAFNIEGVTIRKGPSSLLYGSDALGGVVEILPPSVPLDEGVMGEANVLARSVNGLYGGSLMLGIKRGRWFTRARYSEQHFADFSVPTDTIVYLTQRLPLANGKLNNTAGLERGAHVYVRYGGSRFTSALTLSNAYQKVGFFAGAHGAPSVSNIIDDGNSRDIDLPYSFVNHVKVLLNIKYFRDQQVLQWDLSYQNNHREEWSTFHSHYGTQAPPAEDPDRELAFLLNTYSSGLKYELHHHSRFKSTLSWDVQYQRNCIDGYSFLLPAYQRLTTGLAYLLTATLSDQLTLSGGVRYDVGFLNSEEYIDMHLESYLEQQGYSPALIAAYRVRSQALDRQLGDYSCSFGLSWEIDSSQWLKFNLGRSFRLPGVNELAANGVHHGSFRHERGDALLDSEQGWQADLGYRFERDWMHVELSPFVSWYQNYIYLRPSGQWSMLPHAGQIYDYVQTQALFTGAELAASFDLPFNWCYDLNAEYVFTYNVKEHISLPLSPPFKMLSELSWTYRQLQLGASWQWIATQRHVARNEDKTPGAHLFGLEARVLLPFITPQAHIRCNVDNFFNTKYLNHLSFYRTIEVPEPGRNFQLSLNIPF